MVKRQRASANTSERIGARVKELRKAAGYTQVSLAEACQLDPITISRVERGERSPTLEHLEKLAGLFRVPISKFFDEYESEPDSNEIIALNLLRQLCPEQQTVAVQFLEVYVQLHGRK
jgi:transcriptional regulator with XRE-family HTH domain